MPNPDLIEPFKPADALWLIAGGAAALVGAHFLCTWAVGRLQQAGYQIQPAVVVRPDGSVVQ